MEQYNINPSELFTIKAILLAQDEDYEYLQRYVQIIDLKTMLESLQNKGIILKSYKIPNKGEQFIADDVKFNQNFIKRYYKASFKLGEELFNTYPQFITISGISYNARRVSKKFNDLEEAFQKYGKAIKHNPDVHNQILENIKWGIDNSYNFTTLDDFIADRSWLALEAYRNGNGINVNTEAIKMI